MPMGPIELADTVGLDICAAAGKALARRRMPTPPKRLEELLEAGKLGKKTGEGFYRWEKGKPVKGPADPVTEELINRIMDPYLAEGEEGGRRRHRRRRRSRGCGAHLRHRVRAVQGRADELSREPGIALP